MSHSVVLNVYDLSQGQASLLSRQILGKQIDGIYHTGIVVYGREFYFQGGIQSSMPGRTPFGPPLRSVELGVTDIDSALFNEFLADIRPRFTAAAYDLIRHNCNHFTEECSQFLISRSIPTEIRDLPENVLSTPLGSLLRPLLDAAQQLQPVASSVIEPVVRHIEETAAPVRSKQPALKWLQLRNPVLFREHKRMQMIEKLSSFARDLPDASESTAAGIASLDKALIGESPVPVDFLTDLLHRLPPSNLFPAIDCLRVLILTNPDLSTLLLELLPLTHDAVTAKATRFLLLRAACNLFATISVPAPQCISAATATLDHAEPIVRSAAAALAFNISLNLPRGRNEDGTATLWPALARSVRDESDEDVLFLVLCAIGQLLCGNDVDLAAGLDLSRFTVGRIAEVASEVRAML